MNRDPLYREILKRLAGNIDGALFQACAQDLLQDAYPTLAIMRGGDDAGLDGAIGTPEGAFPLICTVSDRLPDNFRRNIRRNLAERLGPAKAVVATTAEVTPRKRRNLEAEALKLGVRIVNIHDRFDFASRLYRNPKWRRELLGLPGEPPSLSALPRRVRPGGTLLGREEDLEWLRTTQGDLLLVGQPGSGKTYLHQFLASEGRCLFAVDRDLGRLTDAIREQAPSVIVLDDIHTDLDLLESLMRLRIELGLHFALHANCWPGSQRRVAARMNLHEGHVRSVDKLPRSTILALIKEAGIFGPDELLHLLLVQADGKPGLARVLVEACKQHALERVWTGEILADHLIESQDLLRDEQDRCILAAFAIGGDLGNTMESVALTLNLTAIQVLDAVTNLAAGGVLEEATEDRFQVRPAALRPILVRDVFFSGARAIDASPLLVNPLSISEVAHVLLSVAQRSGNIAPTLLEDVVKRCSSRDVWEHFSWVSPAMASLVLERYPERLCIAAPGLLQHHPERTLLALLTTLSGLGVPMCEHSPSPEQRIADWIQGNDPHDGVTADRRRTLLGVLERWVHTAGTSPATLALGLKLLLHPAFELNRQKPGSSREYIFARGLISEDELSSVQALWSRVAVLLQGIPLNSIAPILREVQHWCRPAAISMASLDESAERLTVAAGKRMLLDISKLPQANRTLLSRIASIAAWAQLDVPVELDSIYELLYGSRNRHHDLQTEEAEFSRALRDLAESSIEKPPSAMVKQFLDMEREVNEIPDSPVGRQWRLHVEIARVVLDPFPWIDALIQENAPSSFVEPYVNRVIGLRPELDALLPRLFAVPEYRRLVMEVVLGLERPPSALLNDVLDALPTAGKVDSILFDRRRISESTMFRLLAHSDRSIRVIAAITEWLAPPRGEIRADLKAAWRDAIVLARGEDSYHLSMILEKDPILAYEWFARLLSEDYCDELVAVSAATKALEPHQRLELLLKMTGEAYHDQWFDCLLGPHINLYAQWFHAANDAVKLRPLDRNVSERWKRMAQIALDAGATSAEIAQHCKSRVHSMRGPFSRYYLGFIPAFEGLCADPDERLHAAGRAGLAWAQSNAKRELDSERREEIYG